MCGISAVLSLRGCPVPPNEDALDQLDDQLSKSLDLIQHRGPDARGKWNSGDGNVCERPTSMKEARIVSHLKLTD